MICVGKCDSEDEITEVYRLYKDIEQAYEHTLYDSRLILFGVNKDGSTFDQCLHKLSVWDGDSQDRDSAKDGSMGNGHVSPTSDKKMQHKIAHSKSKSCSAQSHSIDRQKTSRMECSKDAGGAAKAHVLFYPDENQCHDLEEKLQDYVASLFWILDSKRLDRSHERQEKPPLLLAPFEKKDSSGIDTDSRFVR